MFRKRFSPAWIIGIVTLCAGAVLPAWSEAVSESTSSSPKLAVTPPGQGHYAKYDEQIDPLLTRMTLAEKIGQMTQADLDFLGDLSAIEELSLGSVLSGGSSDPPEGNQVQHWSATYDKCQKKALSTRLGIPILYGVDAVHGHSNVLKAVIFPHNIGLGCADDPDLVEQIGRLTALEMRATGIQWNFSPCVTVPRDDRWGRTYEGYSEDPERVTRLGAAMVRGLQGEDPLDPTRVLACAKHFIGDGGTSPVEKKPSTEGLSPRNRLKLDQGDTQCDLETLRRVHLAPYLPCLEAGVGTIMPSYSSWNGLKCSASKQLLTEILKEELGFEGFLISDYNAIDQCHADYKTAIGISINAGMDMAMVPTRYREYIKLLTELVNEGTVPIERIDDAVRRILRVKAAWGLLDPDRSQLADVRLQEEFGAAERRAVGRTAVQKSLVLLKNERGVLPLCHDYKRIHVAGVAADDIGIQCGGWTIDWQGGVGDITEGGTTILEGLRQVAPEVDFTYSIDGTGVDNAEAVIVVVGEKPYAEMKGDDALLTLSDEDQQLIATVCQNDVPTLLVLLSGRPLVLGEAMDKVDTVVAAWLPGTEGAGVADVLLGKVAPTGTLSYTWPRSADQHPINVGEKRHPSAPEPLFRYGYSLKASPGRLQSVSALPATP